MNTWNLKLKSRVTFILAPKREIGINIIKYVQDLMKKLKELSKWQDIPRSHKGRLSIEMSILPTLIYRFHIIPIKNLNELFCRYQQTDYKIYTEAKDSEWPTPVLQENKIGGHYQSSRNTIKL